MKLHNILLIGCFMLSASGCSDYLDIQPKDKQSEEQLFATKGGFYSAANGIYNQMASPALYGANMSFEFLDIISLRYAPLQTSTYYTALTKFNYADQRVDNEITAMWKYAYNTILNCNVVLQNLNDHPGILNEKESSIMRGEMLAARAFLHFDMLRLFGPIYKLKPHAESIPYNESVEIKALPYLPADELVQNKILRDLYEAESLMAGNDPVIENGPMASMEDDTEVYLRYRQLRFNYYTVLALCARVNLYIGDTEKALEYAKKLLDDPQVEKNFPAVDPNKLLANQSNPDRIFSSEVLMGVYKKDRKSIYDFYFDPEQAGSNFLQPRADFVDKFLFSGGTSDYRYQSQWQVATGVGVKGHSFIKYKGIKGPDVNDKNSQYFYALMLPLVRLSEMYYIAAESETELSKRYEWLNKIRAKRGLPALEVKAEDDLMSNIRMEYLREFMGEGQIFYMYKRLCADVIGAENGASQWNAWFNNENTFVLPLPSDEIKNH